MSEYETVPDSLELYRCNDCGSNLKGMAKVLHEANQ